MVMYMYMEFQEDYFHIPIVKLIRNPVPGQALLRHVSLYIDVL